MDSHERNWLTRDEIAEDLQVTKMTLMRWAKVDFGPKYVKLQGIVRYPRSDYEQWKQEVMENAAA